MRVRCGAGLVEFCIVLPDVAIFFMSSMRFSQTKTKSPSWQFWKTPPPPNINSIYARNNIQTFWHRFALVLIGRESGSAKGLHWLTAFIAGEYSSFISFPHLFTNDGRGATPNSVRQFIGARYIFSSYLVQQSSSSVWSFKWVDGFEPMGVNFFLFVP